MEDPHEAAAISTGRDIANHARSDSNGAGTTGALQAPKNDESRIVSSLRETDTSTEENDEGACVSEPTSFDVGNWAPKAWCYSLEYEIGCDSQVDEFE